MALTVGELMVLVETDDDRMRRGLAAAESQARRAGDRIGDGLADTAGDGAERAGTGMASRLSNSLKAGLAGVGLAGGTLLAAGFTEALDQGQITAKMRAQLGATPAEAKKYGQAAGQLFKGAIVPGFQEGADTIRGVVSAGLAPPSATVSQLTKIGTKVADLANTFEFDLGDTTTAVGQLIRTGLVKNANEGLDLLAKGLEGTDKRAEDVLETVTEYSPILQSIGLDGQTSFGLLKQALAAGTKDTDKVIDAFKELHLQVTSGSEASQDALKSLGLDSTQVMNDMAAGGTKGRDAMDLVLDAMAKLGPESQTVKQAVQDLFGGPGEDLGASLFKLDVSKAGAAMDGAAGSADKLGTSLRDNAAHSITQFKQSFQQGLVEFLGNTVIPKLTEFAAFLVDHKEELKAFAAVITAVVVPALLLLGGKALWAGMQMARAWVLGLGPIGWIGLTIAGLVVLIIAYWDDVRKYTLMAWDWVVGKLTTAKDGILEAVSFLGAIPGMISSFFGDAKDWAVKKTLELVAWCAALPGRIGGAISGLGGMLASWASSAWQRFRTATTEKVLSLISYARSLPGKITGAIGSLSGLLYSKGQDLVRGLLNGVRGMGSWLKSQLISFAKNMIPGPIAKALGINSPSKVMRDRIGRWIPAGVVEGIKGGYGAVRSAMTSLVPAPTLPALAPAGAGAAGGYGSPFAAQATGGALVQIENWHAAEHGSPEANAVALEWLAKGRG